MKVIICGAGQVGSAICEALWKTTNIVLIDRDEDKVNELYSTYDIQGIVGSSTSMNILKEAGIETGDIFLAVTNSDETNMISAIIAENCGVPHVYARVRNPEYLEDIPFMKSALGLSEMINPELDAGKLIDQILSFPTANSIENFANGKLQIVGMTVKPNSILDGKTLDEFRSAIDQRIIICAVEREGQVLIPNGAFRVQAGDQIHVTATRDNLKKFYNVLKFQKKSARKILIIGGGQMTYYLLERLSKRNKEVKVIEADYKRCNELALAFPDFEIIHGDGTDQKLLAQEGIEKYEAMVALNDIDEENMIVSLYAKSCGIPKVITKIDRPYFLKSIINLGLDTIITPKRLIADKIIRKTRSLKATQNSSLVNLYKLVDEHIEAMEFEVLTEAAITSADLKTLELVNHTLITGIFRNGHYIVPDGSDQIQVGDLVTIVTAQTNITDINQLVVQA
ncbi:Trk system potassium transporter TrkA [Facklamia languida]